GVLPPGTAPGLAFAVLAAMLAAAAVGALRGQRGGSWALVAWGPLLLVLMVEIATGVISGWRVEAMLGGASVQVFVVGGALFAPVGQLRTHRDSLAASLTEDPLTGVSNRRALARALPRLIGNARDAGQPLSAVFVDVDHFKRINDLDG